MAMETPAVDQGGTMRLSAALREFQDYADDVFQSRHATFQNALGRCMHSLEPGTPLGEVAARSLPTVKFDEWYEAASSTLGSMVGSGTINWPAAKHERVALQLELLRRMASGTMDVLSYCHTFLYASSYHDDNVREFIDQVFRPFARDFLRIVRDDASAAEQLHRPEARPTPDAAQPPLVDATRLAELRTIRSSSFDLSRLICLCEELNACYRENCFHAVAMLTRAILDHVPPILGFATFKEVVSNYAGATSFKQAMEHLQGAARKIADAHLHVPIREKEVLPNATQVNFGPAIDLLLAEIVRRMK